MSSAVELVYEVVVRRYVIGDPSLGVAGAATGSMALHPPRGRPRPPMLKGELPRPLQIGIHESAMLLPLFCRCVVCRSCNYC